MIILYILIGVLMFAGIIFFGMFSSSSSVTSRESFLNKMEKILEKKREPIEDQEKSFRISFVFEGYDFIYEDIEDKIFAKVINKAYLKVKIRNDLILRFTEKRRAETMRLDFMTVSDTSGGGKKDISRVKVPKQLKDFNIYASNVAVANKILDNSKIISIFSSFKNQNRLGHPVLSLRITDGLIVLEFSSVVTYKPSLNDLHDNPTSIETYLDKLLVIAKELEI